MEYTLGQFKEKLSRLIADERAGKVNIQSDVALELINRCLPRNMMAKKLFLEEQEDESFLDVVEQPKAKA